MSPNFSKPVAIANWKMNLTISKTEDLIRELKKDYQDLEEKVDLIICPSFTALEAVSRSLKDSTIKLGAQNVFWEEKGAYTGEISIPMLKELGCGYVILGHSERREYACETDEMVNKKVLAVTQNDLIPIICVGETFEERQAGRKDLVVVSQLNKAFKNIDQSKSIIVAYEPVWVIGSGQAVKPQEAKDTAHVLRQALLDLYQDNFKKENLSLIYGGSVDESNVKDFVDLKIIQGVLVGGASLKIDQFLKIIKEVAD